MSQCDAVEAPTLSPVSVSGAPSESSSTDVVRPPSPYPPIPPARRPSTTSSPPTLPSPTSPSTQTATSSPSPSHSPTSSSGLHYAVPKPDPLTLPHPVLPSERRASAPVRSSPSASPPHSALYDQQHLRSASTTTHFSFKGYLNKLLHSSHSQPSSLPLPSPGPLSPRSSSIPFHVLLQHHRQYSSFLATLETELHAYGTSMSQAHDSMRRLGATLHGMYRVKAVEDTGKRRPVNQSAGGAKLLPASGAAASSGSSLSWLSASFASHTTQAVHIFDTAIQQRLDLLVLPSLQQKRRDSAHIDQLIADDTHNWQRYQHYSQKVADLEATKEHNRRDGKEHADKERYERNHHKLESSRVTYQHCHHILLRELSTSFELRFSFLDSLLLELVKAEQSYHTGLHGQLLPIIVKVKEIIKGERKAAIEAKEEKDGEDEEENTVMMGTAHPTLSTSGFGGLSLSLPTVSSSSLHAHYQLITKIGAGTYGETVLCTDSVDESVWVMKRLQCSNVRHVNRAMAEGMMMQAVKACEYVCHVREVFIEEWSGQPSEGRASEMGTADGEGKEGEQDVRYEGETDGGEEGVEGVPQSVPKADVLCTVCIVMEYGIGGDLQRRISIELSRKRKKLQSPAPALSPSPSPSPNGHTDVERSVSHSFNSVSSNKSLSTDKEQLPLSSSSSAPPAGFPAARVISWMYQLCSGIHSLHSALLVHRDIKVHTVTPRPSSVRCASNRCSLQTGAVVYCVFRSPRTSSSPRPTTCASVTTASCTSCRPPPPLPTLTSARPPTWRPSASAAKGTD